MPRNSVFGALAALVVCAAMGQPSYATPVAGHMRLEATVVQKAQSRGYCEELRRACLYKRELGEAGQGNCRRYQAECGGRNYGPPRYAPDYRGPGRCQYWRNRCANAYGWGTKGWHDCMRYGAPGC